MKVEPVGWPGTDPAAGWPTLARGTSISTVPSAPGVKAPVSVAAASYSWVGPGQDDRPVREGRCDPGRGSQLGLSEVGGAA
ncbi:MAG TPA: hypothetical protein VIJ09_05105 [Acidimicrobiales bacterium]